MMTNYHWNELERAEEVEKRGRQLFGKNWKPSQWHIKILLKYEAEICNRTHKPKGRGIDYTVIDEFADLKPHTKIAIEQTF